MYGIGKTAVRPNDYALFAMAVLCLGAQRACEQAGGLGISGADQARWLARLHPNAIPTVGIRDGGQ